MCIGLVKMCSYGHLNKLERLVNPVLLKMSQNVCIMQNKQRKTLFFSSCKIQQRFPISGKETDYKYSLSKLFRLSVFSKPFIMFFFLMLHHFTKLLKVSVIQRPFLKKLLDIFFLGKRTLIKVRRRELMNILQHIL